MAEFRRFLASLMCILCAPGSLAVSGCATQGAQEYIQSVTYDYAAPYRHAAEQRALREIQDTCYFGGSQYPVLVGPPRIVSVGGPTGAHLQAKQSFYCVGTNSNP